VLYILKKVICITGYMSGSQALIHINNTNMLQYSANQLLTYIIYYNMFLHLILHIYFSYV